MGKPVSLVTLLVAMTKYPMKSKEKFVLAKV